MPGYGRITEIGFDKDSMPELDTPEFYGGSDYDNSVDVSPSTKGHLDPTESKAPSWNNSGMNGQDINGGWQGEPQTIGVIGDNIEAINGGNGDNGASGVNGGATQPSNGADAFGLTADEWAAHQAQMIVDADDARRQKMIHLALAAGAGFLIARFMRS